MASYSALPVKGHAKVATHQCTPPLIQKCMPTNVTHHRKSRNVCPTTMFMGEETDP
jgi:hypothetical protein